MGRLLYDISLQPKTLQTSSLNPLVVMHIIKHALDSDSAQPDKPVEPGGVLDYGLATIPGSTPHIHVSALYP